MSINKQRICKICQSKNHYRKDKCPVIESEEDLEHSILQLSKQTVTKQNSELLKFLIKIYDSKFVAREAERENENAAKLQSFIKLLHNNEREAQKRHTRGKKRKMIIFNDAGSEYEFRSDDDLIAISALADDEDDINHVKRGTTAKNVFLAKKRQRLMQDLESASQDNLLSNQATGILKEDMIKSRLTQLNRTCNHMAELIFWVEERKEQQRKRQLARETAQTLESEQQLQSEQQSSPGTDVSQSEAEIPENFDPLVRSKILPSILFQYMAYLVDESGLNLAYSSVMTARTAFNSYYILTTPPGHSTDSWDTFEGKGNPVQAVSFCNSLRKLKNHLAKRGRLIKNSKLPINLEHIQRFHQMIIEREGITKKKWLWGRQMHLVCVLMFLCIFRSSEVLDIKFSMIEYEKYSTYFTLLVPWRKNRQDGQNIKPFRLHRIEETSSICPLSALFEYTALLDHSLLNEDSHLFYQVKLVNGKERFDYSKKLTYKCFNDSFNTFLESIGYNSENYGTHSFRRGGAQFFNLYWGWPVRMIADWGGWCTSKGNEMNPQMIFHYLTNCHENNCVTDDMLHPDNRCRFKPNLTLYDNYAIRKRMTGTFVDSINGTTESSTQVNESQITDEASSLQSQ